MGVLVRREVARQPGGTQLCDHGKHAGHHLDPVPVLEQPRQPVVEGPAVGHLRQHVLEAATTDHRRLLGGEDGLREVVAGAVRQRADQLVVPALGVGLHHPVGVEQQRANPHVDAQDGGFSAQ